MKAVSLASGRLANDVMACLPVTRDSETQPTDWADKERACVGLADIGRYAMQDFA